MRKPEPWATAPGRRSAAGRPCRPSRFALFAGAGSWCGWLLLALLGAAAAAPVRTEEPDFLKAVLARPVLRPDLPLAEVAAYCEVRVPGMPEIQSRAAWERYAARTRTETLRKVVFRGGAAGWRDAKTRVEWLGVMAGGPGYRIRKLRYEALPGLWIPALLYEPERLSGRVPVVLNVNGHDREGKAAGYKQIRCTNQARRGMLALNPDWYGMGQLNAPGYHHELMNAIDLCGAGGIAVHYLLLKRGLDVLLSLEHADPRRVAVTGLSGGGWQTIFISALDPRVTLTNPVAGYSSFRTRTRHHTDLGDSEQTPCDLATVTDYTQFTAMMAPRPTLLTYNAKDDCCFRADHALPPLLEAAGPIFKLYGKPENLRSHVNEDPGTHNYLLDNRQAHYRMLGDHFYAGSREYQAEEIPSDAEVKTAEQLRVELPAGNKDFHTLALELSRDLPHAPELPRDRAAAREWQWTRSARLRKVVRAKDYPVQAEKVGGEEKGELKAVFWKLRMAGEWSVPAVELTRGEPGRTLLVVADGGRQSLDAVVRKRLGEGERVLAVDPFYLGESLPQPANRAYLWPLLVSTVGDRPLGLQASQLAAAARWVCAERKSGPVSLVAVGPRSSTAALVAASLEKKAIGGLELHEAPGTLKELIEKGTLYSQAPELFCFGLLEEFDIQQLAALAAPRPVRLLGTW